MGLDAGRRLCPSVLMSTGQETVTPGRAGSLNDWRGRRSKRGEEHVQFVSMADIDGYHEQLQRDAQFLCSDRRLDTELVDGLVLQLNRIHPQILNDKEAHRFRKLNVPTEVRLAELLKHLQAKGEEACHEFYRGLHIHAEDVYFSLPSRVKHRGPMFFLSCFSFAVGLAILYYYGESDALRGTSAFFHYAAGLGSGAKDVFISYAEVGTKKK